MSRSERENFVPETAVEARADRLSRDWNAATERAYTVPLHFARAAEKMGDFTQSAVEAAINEVRETYDAGYQTYNLIEEVIESDCTGKWSMLLKTALPAAGAALWLLLVPQPQEILEEYLTPKNLKTTGRGGADAKKVRRKPGKSGRIRRIFPKLPDTNKLIADMIPGSQWVQGRRVGRADRWLFTGINVADRIFWHWLVLEATEEFFTTWSSGIMESRFCSSPITYLIVGTMGALPIQNLTAQINDPDNYDIEADKGRQNDPSRIIHFSDPINGSATFSFDLSWSEPIRVVIASNLRLVIYRNGTETRRVTIPVQITVGSTSATMAGEVSLQNEDEVYISAGSIATSPSPTSIKGGAVFAYGDAA